MQERRHGLTGKSQRCTHVVEAWEESLGENSEHSLSGVIRKERVKERGEDKNMGHLEMEGRLVLPVSIAHLFLL